MPYHYRIDRRPGCVILKGWGKVSLSDLLAHIKQILKGKSLPCPYKHIIDFREVTEYYITSDDVFKLKNELNRYGKKMKNPRIAVLASSDQMYDTSKITDAITVGGYEVKGFKVADKAIEFLDIVAPPNWI